MPNWNGSLIARPRSKDRSRVNATGRAYAGSQRQIQTYVNDHPEELSRAFVESLQLEEAAVIRWLSPVREDGYAEYRDGDFLRVLGIGHLAPMLANFWPRGGPCWDALATIEGGRGGVILVEAKSHPPEIYGGGCRAAGASLAQIQRALNATKQWLGVDAGADWTGPLYQSANRYAHLYFLREIGRVNAYLVNVYFIGDPHSPTERDEWQQAIHNVQNELGVAGTVGFTRSVFVRALW